MAFRGRSTRPGRVVKRKSLWIGFGPFTDILGSNTTAIFVASLNAAALAFRPFTIVRSHFVFRIISDQAAAAEEQTSAIGGVVVSEQSVAIGISALPTPVIDSDSSLFFLHQYLMADQSSTVDLAKPGQIYQVDSKAMRKVELGQDIAFTLEGGGINGGATIASAGRILIKTN